MAVTANLSQIITKVRFLTRSPSQSNITDSQVTDYINTFLLYDFPEHLRLFSLKTTLDWYCQPYLDLYPTNSVPGLENFANINITTDKPMYVAGYQVYVSQSREEFFSIYPMLNTIQSIGISGDGSTTNFQGMIQNFPSASSPNGLVVNQVSFTSINSNNQGLYLSDQDYNPFDPSNPFTGTGTLTGNGSGTINYVTGQFNITFSSAPGPAQPINSQTIPYVASRPQSILFFDNYFQLRPIPDQPYKIDLEVYVRPTELLQSGAVPQLEQWWQYIAYGAAKKILEDRMDLDSVALIMPEFKMQERLVLRTSIVDQTKERTSTIYTQQLHGGGAGGFWGGFGGSNF